MTNLDQVRKLKVYWVIVRDLDGNESKYLFDAPSRRRARAYARRWVAETSWNATLVSITPGFQRASFSRLVAVAGITLVASGTAIFTGMVVGLVFEGAL
jgi:hypothetical protein